MASREELVGLAEEIEQIRRDMDCGAVARSTGVTAIGLLVIKSQAAILDALRSSQDDRVAEMREPDTLTRLRAEGWRVAVHNDYRLDGEDRTFWLLTHPDGRWTKGEGTTDASALHLASLDRPPPPSRDRYGRSLPLTEDGR